MIILYYAYLYFFSKYNGEKWCFLGDDNNSCVDKKASKSLSGYFWSTDACITPSKTSSKCSKNEGGASLSKIDTNDDTCTSTGGICTQSTDCCNGYEPTAPSCGVVCEQGKCGTAILCNKWYLYLVQISNFIYFVLYEMIIDIAHKLSNVSSIFLLRNYL